MLSYESHVYSTLRKRLLEIEPDLDETTLNDTLEGMTNLHDAIEEIVRSALLDEAMAAGLRARQDELKSRLARLENRASKKRNIARDAMTEHEIRKIAAPDFTLSLRNSSPSVIVSDEEKIPEKYWDAQPPKLNKRAILDDLKNGLSIAGTNLSNSPLSLSIRRK